MGVKRVCGSDDEKADGNKGAERVGGCELCRFGGGREGMVDLVDSGAVRPLQLPRSRGCHVVRSGN